MAPPRSSAGERRVDRGRRRLPGAALPVLLVLLAAAAAAGCLSDDSAEGEEHKLEIGDALVARSPPNATPMVPIEPEAEVGDKLHPVVRDVGPFQPGPEDNRHAALEITVQDEAGEVVHNSSANMSFLRETMPGFRGAWPTDEVEPGSYTVTFRVTDRIAQVDASTSLDVRLVEELQRDPAFGAEGYVFLLQSQGRRAFNPSAAYERGDRIDGGLVEVGPFQVDENGTRHGEGGFVVRDAAGQRILNESYELDSEGADSEGYYYLVASHFDLPRGNGPGEYDVTFWARDLVADATFEVTRDFAVLG